MFSVARDPASLIANGHVAASKTDDHAMAREPPAIGPPRIERLGLPIVGLDLHEHLGYAVSTNADGEAARVRQQIAADISTIHEERQRHLSTGGQPHREPITAMSTSRVVLDDVVIAAVAV